VRDKQDSYDKEEDSDDANNEGGGIVRIK